MQHFICVLLRRWYFVVVYEMNKQANNEIHHIECSNIQTRRHCFIAFFSVYCSHSCSSRSPSVSHTLRTHTPTHPMHAHINKKKASMIHASWTELNETNIIISCYKSAVLFIFIFVQFQWLRLHYLWYDSSVQSLCLISWFVLCL